MTTRAFCVNIYGAEQVLDRLLSLKGTLLTDESILIRDRDVANLTSMSASWVRGQRHARRHGMPHLLDLDPVMLGSTPLYPREHVVAWIQGKLP